MMNGLYEHRLEIQGTECMAGCLLLVSEYKPDPGPSHIRLSEASQVADKKINSNMMSDDYLVECKLDDDDDEEEELQQTPSPPPQFSSSMDSYLSQAETRDPYGINQHLKIELSDVLAEPASLHSADRVWIYSGIGFEAARIWSYRCLTALCAAPLSLLSGGLFAWLACVHIWCLTPCVQMCHSCLPCVRSLWLSTINIFIAPFCLSVSRCCRGVYISLSEE
ncbi:caveolin-2-like [Arapaima gigas]